MNHLPSIQTLRAFEAAYRRQSYSKAAQDLGLTHGAISHRIRELENRLQVRLFRREGGRMAPTEQARKLLTQVRPALRMLEQAFETRPSKTKNSLLTISVLPAFATRWLVSRLEGFRRAHPDIRLTIKPEAKPVAIDGLEADAAIRYGLGSWPGVQSIRLSDERLFPVCSPKYREQMRIKYLTDLAHCVLLRHSWQSWEPWLHASGLVLKESLDGPLYEDSDLLLKAAEAGEGVALARRFLAEDELRSGRLVRLFEEDVIDSYAYFFVWQPHSKRVTEVQAFGTWLQGCMAS